MYQKKTEIDLRSPLEFGLDVFSAKWHSRIICELSNTYPLRYSQLRTLLSGVTDTALAHALNRLCSHGIIQRTQTDEVPSRAVYALTEMGWSVIPIFESICQWSGRYYQPEDGHTLIKCRNCDKCFQNEKHETKASLPKETP